jgi:hypothetical protein
MRTMVAALVVGFHLCLAVAQDARRPLVVPDVPGYVTLKGDFHLHSVFSDGEVWPTVHVREAWRDGLDVIALTEHVEYRPHKADVSGGPRRAYEVARPLAERLGLLLVPGAEITRPVPGAKADIPVGSAHFNVLFATDLDALDTPELFDALDGAKQQGAFVVWDHPGFMGAPARWFPHIEPLHGAGLFGGVEVVNGDQFYPEALEWTREKSLTALAASDAHLPMPAHLKSARRPVTLVFAKTRDLGGVKEALVAGRTLAWLDTHVWGSEQWLTALWSASVRAEPASATAGGEVTLTLRNQSSIDYDVEIVGVPAWLALPAARLAREAATSVRGRLAADAPRGSRSLRLAVRVANLQPAAGVPLETVIEVDVSIE